jgi:hypothetical protein
MVTSDKSDTLNKISRQDKVSIDKIDQLPLSIIPLQSNSLKSAKLFKNARLETVLELYNDPVSGSLQIPADENLSEALGMGDSEAVAHDTRVIQQLSQLHSFDIFSMRTSLQRIGLDLELDDDVFQLSDEMKTALQKYANAFTAPLIRKIYGLEQAEIDKLGGDLNNLFQDPDKATVRQNLLNMSESTGIPLEEIPVFIQNYNDIYQSVAYYRYTYDAVIKDAERFLVWISAVVAHKDVASTPQTLKVCLNVERDMRFILSSLRARFDLFRKSFQAFWQDINAQSFAQLRRDVSKNYDLIGAVLCAVVVKINAWSEGFPNNDVGSPSRRSKFIMTDLAPGIADIRRLEQEARKLLDMDATRN